MNSSADIEQVLRDYGLRRVQSRSWDEAADRWVMTTSHKADHHRDIAKLQWLAPYFSGLRLSDIDEDLLFQVSHIKKQEASPSTANRHLALIRSILRAARDDWHWIHWVPRIRFFPEPEHRVRWLRPLEARNLIYQLPPHLSAMARFTLATGLRQSNVSYLRWDQIDMRRSLAWVNAADSKSRRSFSVPLNRAAQSVLTEWSGTHPNYVFVYQGNPVSRCSTAAWTKAKKRAGIQDFRWHDLRHTWASWHVQNGTSLYELQELGGMENAGYGLAVRALMR